MHVCGFKCTAKFQLAIAFQVIVLETLCKRLRVPPVLHYVGCIAFALLPFTGYRLEGNDGKVPALHLFQCLSARGMSDSLPDNISHVTSRGTSDRHGDHPGSGGLQQDITNFYCSQQGRVEDIYPGSVSGKGYRLMSGKGWMLSKLVGIESFSPELVM